MSLRGFRFASSVLVVLAVSLVHCESALDACAPTEVELGFFSKGDCVFTRASFFQGHEWLTWFGNRDLPSDDRFTDAEIVAIAEGNRRVDWPKELLVHLNNSVIAYIDALTEYTDRPENQRLHCLLTDKNDSPQALADARASVTDFTRGALRAWVSERTRALTLIGKANHVLQDSFSQAHTVREPSHPQAPWCVRKVKAYVERAPGHDTPDIEYHGASNSDGVGHTTSQDSIYREGRECHEPVGSAEVEACLSDTAQRARAATRAHLAAVRRLIAANLSEAEVDQRVDAELEAFFAEHMELCP